MTNREIYDAALAMLAEEQYEDCADYEARAPYLIAAFINECSEAGSFYRSSRGEAVGEWEETMAVELDGKFPLPGRFAAAGAFYLASLLIETENETFSDRLFARYADEITRILHDGCPGITTSIRDVYAFEA